MDIAAPAARAVTIRTETLLRGTLGLMLALSCLSFVEPSPYEFFFFLLVPVAILSGLVLTRTTLVFFFLIFAVVAPQLVALFPYIQHQPVEGSLTPTVYTISTVYLYASALLFALIFSRNAGPRLTLCIKAYAISCVFAGLWGFAAYFDIGGLGAREPIVGRIAGPFKDPNVLGSYCVLGALSFLQRAVIGQRWRLINFICFLIVTSGGIFMSFSRGSWLALTAATLLMGLSTYVTAQDAWIKKRVRRGVFVLALLTSAGGAIVVSTPSLRDTFTDRVQVAQDYDSGETGRFGNQRRSINMLLERPFGFGPFRFPLYFTLQPHNSYVGAFADGGWISGFAFLLLVGTTSVLIIRLLFAWSPLLRQAQVIGPALFAFFLQAFQIDIDHWRFVFLMFGAVWGMYAALAHTRSARVQSLPIEGHRRPLLRESAT